MVRQTACKINPCVPRQSNFAIFMDDFALWPYRNSTPFLVISVEHLGQPSVEVTGTRLILRHGRRQNPSAVEDRANGEGETSLGAYSRICVDLQANSTRARWDCQLLRRVKIDVLPIIEFHSLTIAIGILSMQWSTFRMIDCYLSVEWALKISASSHAFQ